MTNPSDEIKTFSVIDNPYKLKKILDEGADVNSIVNTNSKQTLLHRLASYNDAAGIKIAIEKNPDVNAKDNYEYTPLHELVSSNVRRGDAAPAVRLLIDAGANVNEKNTADETALMLAIKNEQINSAEILIASGANLNVQNYERKTALILAAERGETRIAKKLLQAGANPYLEDESGHDAAYYAHKNNYDDLGSTISSYQDFNKVKGFVVNSAAAIIGLATQSPKTKIPPQNAPEPLVYNVANWRSKNTNPVFQQKKSMS